MASSNKHVLIGALTKLVVPTIKTSMIVKLLAEHHLEFLSLKEGCRGSSESTLVKMSKWKSHATAHISASVHIYFIK